MIGVLLAALLPAAPAVGQTVTVPRVDVWELGFQCGGPIGLDANGKLRGGGDGRNGFYCGFAGTTQCFFDTQAGRCDVVVAGKRLTVINVR